MRNAEIAPRRDSFERHELELRVLFEFLWRHWRPILAATILGAALGAGSSFLFKPLYQADAVLIPADDFGSQINQTLGLGGVASLIGIAAPASQQTEEALATLKSRALIESYVTQSQLLPVLFPAAWDRAKQAWRSSDPRKVPTAYDGFQLFTAKILNIISDKKTGLITISVKWNDPTLAERWTADLVGRTNSLLRERAIERSNINLAYLNAEVEKTSTVELRSAIYKLIEAEVKKSMIAHGSKDYAFRYVDPMVKPERPIFPNRILFLLGGGFAGFLCGAFVSYLLTQKGRARSGQPAKTGDWELAYAVGSLATLSSHSASRHASKTRQTTTEPKPEHPDHETGTRQELLDELSRLRMENAHLKELSASARAKKQSKQGNEPGPR
jgi:uncharacterized protein involved in exopolysaccharide biosynthesis